MFFDKYAFEGRITIKSDFSYIFKFFKGCMEF